MVSIGDMPWLEMNCQMSIFIIRTGVKLVDRNVIKRLHRAPVWQAISVRILLSLARHYSISMMI